MKEEIERIMRLHDIDRTELAKWSNIDYSRLTRNLREYPEMDIDVYIAVHNALQKRGFIPNQITMCNNIVSYALNAVSAIDKEKSELLQAVAEMAEDNRTDAVEKIKILHKVANITKLFLNISATISSQIQGLI